MGKVVGAEMPWQRIILVLTESVTSEDWHGFPFGIRTTEKLDPSVPEPASLALLAIGFAGLAAAGHARSDHAVSGKPGAIGADTDDPNSPDPCTILAFLSALGSNRAFAFVTSI